MSSEDTNSYIETLNRQIGSLLSRAGELKLDTRQDEVLATAMEGLSTALEELQVTEEELRMQYEELLMTRHALEEERVRYQSLFEFAPDAYIVTNRSGNIEEANRAAAQLLNIRQDHLLSKPLNIYFAPKDRRKFHDRLSEMAEAGEGTQEWEAMLQPRKSAPIYAAITITAVRSRTGDVVAFRWMLRDVTRQKQVEKEIRDLNDRLEERVRERTAMLEHQTELKEEALQGERAAREEAEALREIGSLLSSTLQLSEVLELVLNNVGRVLPHDGVSILLLEGENAVLTLCKDYEHCNGKERLSQWRFPIKSTFPLKEMAESGSPMIIDDLDKPIPWIKVFLPKNNFKSFMGIPILSRDQIIGFLSLTSKRRNFFQSAHIKPLQAFAALAAIAIQNAQLYQKMKDLAILEERQRLARDLHDAVTQTLFTSSIVAESLPQLMKNKPHETQKHLENLIRLNRGALAEMRTLLLELRPAHLTDIHLSNQLHQLVNAIRGRKDIEIQLTIHDGVPIPSDVQVAFYRIAQEAFNNISKHSRATRADVTLITTPDKVELSIHDNGRGFDPEISLKGMGLSSMTERAGEVDASLEIISAPGKGTLIHILWGGGGQTWRIKHGSKY
jgi:PAS domain S-box-containing protein